MNSNDNVIYLKNKKYKHQIASFSRKFLVIIDMIADEKIKCISINLEKILKINLC